MLNYVEGDPNEPQGLFQDLTPFVKRTHRELLCLTELIQAKRYEEAETLAREEAVRAALLLRKLEAEPYRRVDLERTEDATDERARVYKG